MANENNKMNTNEIGQNPTANSEKNINTNTSNTVGPSRRYVSGNEEKSSSSHQFQKGSGK